PPYSASVDAAGKALGDHRRSLMLGNHEGLTQTYNRVHKPENKNSGIVRIRELHHQLDLAVQQAYEWTDLNLDHGFHETSQGLRFTIGPFTRMEILDRLLEINHRRHGDEVAAGPNRKNGRRSKGQGDGTGAG